MKRFISNIGLLILGIIGFVGIAGNALLEGYLFFQLIVIAASFYCCVACFRELAKRLAAHLPDEDC